MITRIYRCRSCNITLALSVMEEDRLDWQTYAATEQYGTFTECPRCKQCGSLYPLEEVSP